MVEAVQSWPIIGRHVKGYLADISDVPVLEHSILKLTASGWCMHTRWWLILGVTYYDLLEISAWRGVGGEIFSPNFQEFLKSDAPVMRKKETKYQRPCFFLHILYLVPVLKYNKFVRPIEGPDLF